MKQSIPHEYSFKSIEKKWCDHWVASKIYEPLKDSQKPKFSIVLPPPNVTGVLHMGHAFGSTIQDISTRFKRMKGFNVLWIPGTDHAGIASQTVVDKHLRKSGINSKDLTRDEFTAHIWDWKEKHEKVIHSQLKDLGLSLAWDHARFTLDEISSSAVNNSFSELFKRDLIYQGNYLVNWDPVAQTALADDEVEYEDQEGFIWSIAYQVVDCDESIVIATTRPETLLGDTAIAVHPEDERYVHLHGKSVLVPLVNRVIPIITDTYVKRDFGTGAVKITPAHDPNDYEIGLRHSLPMINIMNTDGSLNDIFEPLKNINIQSARFEIIDYLTKEDSLVSCKKHINRVGVSYRSKAVIQPYLSTQWFLRMSAFKQELRDYIESGKISLIPDSHKKTYFHWIDNLRDWCISRQLIWGHRIPVFTHNDTKETIVVEDVNNHGLNDDWVQETDVLDTWFSSALWPFSTLGTEGSFFPNALLVTGHDILFFWVARMILMSHIIKDSIPFEKVYIHGLIFGKSYWKEDEDGSISYLSKEEYAPLETAKSLPDGIFSKWEKMSKSKGNIIDPLEITKVYGRDALRLTLASCATGSSQIDLDVRRFEEYKNFTNKFWNATRFIFMQLGWSDDDTEVFPIETLSNALDENSLDLTDSWILKKLTVCITKCDEYYESMEFDKALHTFYHFFWDDFCAQYIEMAKSTLNRSTSSLESKRNKQRLLLAVLSHSIRLLHPIAPHITEEIYFVIKDRMQNILDCSSSLFRDVVNGYSHISCAYAPFPKVSLFPVLPTDCEENFTILSEAIHAIRLLRGEMQIHPKTSVTVYVEAKSTSIEYKEIIENLTNTLLESAQPDTSLNFSAKSTPHYTFQLEMSDAFIDKEKKRLLKDKELLDAQISSLHSKLTNTQFISNAPDQIVKKVKDQYEKANDLLEKIVIKLSSLT